MTGWGIFVLIAFILLALGSAFWIGYLHLLPTPTRNLH